MRRSRTRFGGFWRWAGLAAAMSAAAPQASLAQDQQGQTSRAATGAVSAPQGCDTPLPDGFSETEQWAWSGVCQYGYADLSSLDDAGCASNSDDEWPETRHISQAFLDTILFKAPYKNLPEGESIRIRCAVYPEQIDFSYREIEPALLLDDSRMPAGVSLFNARTKRLLSLRGDNITGDVNGDRLQVADNFFSREGTRVEGRLTLSGAKIGGNVEAGGSTYTDGVNLDAATIEGTVFVNGGAWLGGELRLVAAHVGRTIDISGSTFNGPVNVDSARIGGGFFSNKEATFNDQVVLRAARVGSGVEASDSTYNGEFTLDRANVEGSVFVRNATFNAGLVFASAQVGSNIEMSGATVAGVFNAESLQLDKTLYMNRDVVFKSPAYLRYSAIGGNVLADGATFESGLYATGLRIGRSFQLQDGADVRSGLWLDAADIADSLFLSGATLDGRINFQGATIGNELALSDPTRGDPTFGADSFMVLRNTRIGALRARPEAWTREDGEALPTDMVGFAYERESALDSREMASMLSAPPEQLIKWLSSQRGPDGAPHDATYNPQPYEQLQAALIREGRFEKARAIKYAQFEHYRRAQTTPELRRYGMVVLKFLAGYGVYPVMAVFWFGGLVVLGWLIGHASPGLSGFSTAEIFWFSFDNALPLVELSEHNKRVVHERDWVTTFFNGQRIFGLVLATALIGAVSLL